MKKKIILSVFFTVAVAVSCDKKQEEHSDRIISEQSTSDSHADHDGQAQSEDRAGTPAGLELDNGKKWNTNTEMLPFIKEQERLIEGFDSDTGDYKKLAADLNSANDKLIKSCTMKGKSHDVLHVWLTDHMKNIDLLAKAGNRDEANQITDALKNSMEVYHQYFN